MTCHQINEEREDLRVMVMTQVKTDTNAHEEPITLHLTTTHTDLNATFYL
jgi:hypothetical protein